jgi:hypothetical protein
MIGKTKKKTTSQTKTKKQEKILKFPHSERRILWKKASSVLGCTCTCAQDNLVQLYKKILK